MEINVSQLLKEPIGSSRKYTIDETIDITGDGRESPVSGDVGLLRTQRGVLVRGKLQAELELTCSRCLSSFDYPLNISFEEEYIQTIDVNSGLPLQSSEEPGLFTIDEHHVINLSEAIRQYTLLAVPMKPLCHEDCAGLCPTCGRNLNLGDCSCLVETVDPRWSKLMGLQ
ncbi:MAG TPA: DUF177 domain-containing protein [Dehalococcoidia bacterium]|nr:DUF177 domain-containing protein [Dehalococcoidia bacterium]